MSFSTPLFFLIFLPLALVGFEVMGYLGRQGAVAFLSLASFYFYYRWSHDYFWILGASIFLNYLISLAIVGLAKRPKAQSAGLVLGIALNLFFLCYFKYLFPMLHSLSRVGITHRDWGSVILPLGISFFTFTQISYLIDLKQGIAQPESLLSYSLFVNFFPHLVSGPIIRYRELMPQFSEKRRYRLNSSDLATGLTWFTMGLVKKVMVADRIAPVADAFFSQPHGVGAASAWLGVLTYSMQLYFDFSGYSDMAIGLARMFSIRFPLNFNSPYKSTSIIDFWQRWHITLTRYIMDYLYAPIQFRVTRSRLEKGKKVSRKAWATPEGFAQMIAMPTLVTLCLAGVWHGAGLQFFLYGLLHGTYIVINHAWRTFLPVESRLRKMVNVPVSVGITYLAVVVAEVFFRANRLRDVRTILGDMVGHHGLGPAWPLSQMLILAGLFAVVWLMPNTQQILGETEANDLPTWSIFPTVRWRPTLPWWVATTVAFTISMFYSTANATFLYFKF